VSFHENRTNRAEILVRYWDLPGIDVHQFWWRWIAVSLRYPQLKLSVSYLSTRKSDHFADFVADLQVRVTILLMLIPQCDCWLMRYSNSISCTRPQPVFFPRLCLFFHSCCFLPIFYCFSFVFSFLSSTLVFVFVRFSSFFFCDLSLFVFRVIYRVLFIFRVLFYISSTK